MFTTIDEDLLKDKSKLREKNKNRKYTMLVVHCIVAVEGALQPQSNVISQTRLKKWAKRDENEEKVGKIHGCLRSAGAVRESPSSPLIQFSSHIQHCSYLSHQPG